MIDHVGVGETNLREEESKKHSDDCRILRMKQAKSRKTQKASPSNRLTLLENVAEYSVVNFRKECPSS
jgi:hypothetical protein